MFSSAANQADSETLSTLNQKRIHLAQRLNQIQTELNQSTEKKTQLAASLENARSKEAAYNQLLAEKKEQEGIEVRTQTLEASVNAQLEARLNYLEQLTSPSLESNSLVELALDQGPTTPELIAFLNLARVENKKANDELASLEIKLTQLAYNENETSRLTAELEEFNKQSTMLQTEQSRLRPELQAVCQRMKEMAEAEKNIIIAYKQAKLVQPRVEPTPLNVSSISDTTKESKTEIKAAAPSQKRKAETSKSEAKIDNDKDVVMSKEKDEEKSNKKPKDMITVFLASLDRIQALGENNTSQKKAGLAQLKDSIRAEIAGTHEEKTIQQLEGVKLLVSLAQDYTILSKEETRKNIRFQGKDESTALGSRFKGYVARVNNLEKNFSTKLPSNPSSASSSLPSAFNTTSAEFSRINSIPPASSLNSPSTIFPRLTSSGLKPILKSSSAYDPLEPVSSSALELAAPAVSAEKLKEKTHTIATQAFDQTLNILMSIKFSIEENTTYIAIAKQIEKYYRNLDADMDTNSNLNINSPKWGAIANLFNVLHQQVKKNSVPNTNALSELFANHIAEVINLNPQNYTKILHDLLDTLIRTPHLPDFAGVSNALQFGTIELASLMKEAQLAKPSTPIEADSGQAEEEAIEQANAYYNEAIDFMEEKMVIAPNNLPLQNRIIAKAIKALLDAASIYKNHGKIKDHADTIAVLAEKLEELADSLISLTEAKDRNPLAAAKQIECYQQANYYYNRSIILLQSIERAVEPALYLSPLYSLNKILTLDKTKTTQISAQMTGYIKHFELPNRASSWTDPEAVKDLQLYKDKFPKPSQNISPSTSSSSLSVNNSNMITRKI